MPLAYKTTLWLNDRLQNISHSISIQNVFLLWDSGDSKNLNT